MKFDEYLVSIDLIHRLKYIYCGQCNGWIPHTPPPTNQYFDLQFTYHDAGHSIASCNLNNVVRTLRVLFQTFLFSVVFLPRPNEGLWTLVFRSLQPVPPQLAGVGTLSFSYLM